MFFSESIPQYTLHTKLKERVQQTFTEDLETNIYQGNDLNTAFERSATQATGG